MQRFRLPEDPERRLEWVLFLFEVNKQRLKESSWTDITICSEHFTDDCFVSLALSGSVQLKPGAVPSLWVNTEPEEPVESPQDEVSQLRDHLLLDFTGSLKNCSQASLHVALRYTYILCITERETETCLQNKSDFQMNVISMLAHTTRLVWQKCQNTIENEFISKLNINNESWFIFLIKILSREQPLQVNVLFPQTNFILDPQYTPLVTQSISIDQVSLILYFKVKRLYFFHYPSIRRKDLLPQTNFTKDQQHQKLSEIAYMNTVDLKYIKWHKLFLMALHGVWIAILSVAILRQVYHISIFLLSAI